MDALPTYADLVFMLTTFAFWFCYLLTATLRLWDSRTVFGVEVLAGIVVALMAGLSGSLLSLLVAYQVFGRG